MVSAPLFALAIFFSTFSYAEYRVFTLRIETGPEDVAFVASTLDPDQYRGYHHVPAGAIITYVDTWKCYGRTDGMRPFCPNPRPPAESPDMTTETPPTP